jgi:hypothetical protein
MGESSGPVLVNVELTAWNYTANSQLLSPENAQCRSQRIFCDCIKVDAGNVENPGFELEEHYFNPDCQRLVDLGYVPSHDIEAQMEIMLKHLARYKHRIEAWAHALILDTRCDESRRRVSFFRNGGGM